MMTITTEYGTRKRDVKAHLFFIATEQKNERKNQMKKTRHFIQRMAVVLAAVAMVFQAVPFTAFAEEATEAETVIGIETEETTESRAGTSEGSKEDAIIMAVDAYLDSVTEETTEETTESQTEVSIQNEEKIEAAQATEGRPSEETEETKETEAATGETAEKAEAAEPDDPEKENTVTEMKLASASPLKAASGNINVSTYPDYGDGDMLYYTNDFASTYGSYWPAYCIDHGLHAPDGQDYYPTASQNNAIGYIMEHGYPNETWGLGWAEAQYLTQSAVYGVMGGHSAMYEISNEVHSPAWIWAAVFGGYYEEGSWSVNGNFAYAESLYQAAMAYANAEDAQFALFYTPYDGNYQRMVVPVPVPKTEPVTVKKTTSNTTCSAQLEGNGMYSQDFSGAQFTVYVDGTSWGTYTTGSNESFTVNDVPVDSYVSVKETKAPAGYLLNSKETGITVTKGGSNTITVTDEPTFDVRRISVYKVAYINEQMTKQYVKGAVFKMEYFDNTDCSGTATRTWYFETKDNGRFYYAADWLASGYTSDALYKTPGGDADLPVGSFKITEVYSPKGYKLSDTVLKGKVVQPSNGTQAESSWISTTGGNIIVESDGTASFGDTPKYGTVTIEKLDADLKETNSGDTTFDGVEVQVINASGRTVTLKDGIDISDGAVAATLVFQSGAHSVSTGNVLPMGTYTIKESKTNKWYEMNTAWSDTATLTDDGSDVLATAYASGKKTAELTETPLRATISLYKIDRETGKAEPQGEGSLENAEISIYNISENPVKVNGTVYESYKGKSAGWIRENGTACCVVYTDAEGNAETPALPGGTYLALETAASEGYLVNTEWAPVITINGPVLKAGNTKCDTPLEEQIIRGDLKAIKTEINGHKRANIPFAIDRIEKQEDGSWEIVESHVIVSDEKGIIDTAKKRSGNANSFDQYEQYGIFTDDSKLDPAVGVWFGEQSAVNDEAGALIYGTYQIRELQCKANMGEDLLLSNPIEVKADSETAEYDDILVDLSVELHSILTDKESGTHSIPCKGSVTVEDKITYTNLKNTMTYTMKAEIVLADDPDTVLATFTKDFRPSGTETSETVNSGEITLSGTIDTSGYEGREIASRVTLIEHISGNSIMISTHNQALDDPDQSAYVVKISTTAKDMATGDNVGAKSEKDKIQDTVLCENLAPSSKYVLKASLVDKETGDVIGTVDKVFTTRRSAEHYIPETEITMPEFTVDSSAYAEKTRVVLESLYRCEGTDGNITILDDEPVDVHDSLLDEKQSIFYVDVKTDAADGATGDHVGTVAETATVVDHVSCTNLVIGKEYTIKGELMYQADFTDANGKFHKKGSGSGVKAEVTFTAGAKNEVHDMTFTYDTSILEGAAMVVFEDVYHNNVKIAWHADLEDESQTIWYPKVRTMAVDTDTNDATGAYKKDASITDKVSVSNMVPGMTYTVEGKLVYAKDFTDKDGNVHKAGEELEQDGITMLPVTFTAEKSAEIHEVTFTGIDAAQLEGASIVVFEYLYHPKNNEGENKPVASHEDISDTDQTIHYVKIGTTLTDTETHTHLVRAEKEITVIDTVTFENLVPGKKYSFTGILYDKATGEPLLDAEGKEVTSELVDFVPETADGSVEISFTFMSVTLTSRTIVAAETVWHEGVEVAVHKDLTDKDQTVYIPEIGTTLTDSNGQKMFIGSKKAVLEDVVSYKNLPAGTYTMFGKLINKADGKVVSESSQVFTVETDEDSADGTVTVTFTFDTDKHEGKILVAYEYLFEGELKKMPKSGEKAVHENPDDEGQTVYIPKVGTVAAAEDGGKTLPVSAKAVIKDTVEYFGLIPGREYLLRASVYDKTSGKLLEGMTAEAKFTPKDTTGKVIVDITVDTTGIQGHNLVVFEELYVLEASERLIAEHKDVNDKDQAVTVYSPQRDYPKTGDSSNMWIWIVAFAAAGAGLIAAYIVMLKKNSKNKKEKAD